MLQQILQDMYVDPELLCRLKDEQRRTLFCKMREEQVRRYNAWQLSDSNKFLKPRLPPKPGKKRVRFALGEDGEPKAVVVGDADAEEMSSSSEDEPGLAFEDSFLDILRRKSIVDGEKRARILADDEGDEEVRVTLLRSEMFIRDMEQREEKEKKDWLAKKQEQLKARQDTLQKVTEGLSQTSIHTEDSTISKQATDVDMAANNDLKIPTDVTKAWEQKKIKDLALKAMDFHKRLQEKQNEGLEVVMGNNRYNSSKRQLSIPVSRTKNRPDKPPSRAAIIEWFRSSESHKVAAIDPATGQVADWFHGMISRLDAEKVLLQQPVGTYLVRMSERIWGYAISYRTPDRCKHFLIDATTNYYQFFGDGNTHHASLAELVQYHRVHPITESGQEYLLTPCPQPRLNPNVWELFQ